MSFKAKLFIEDEERTVLDAHLVYHRFSDLNGKPTSKTIGGPLQFNIESTGNDSLFYEHMFSPTSQMQGEIIFYKRDGLSTLFKIEFANAHIIGLQENFRASGEEPLHLNITIGWGIIKVRNLIFEEYWNPSNPFVAQTTPTEIEKDEEEEPEITNFYITDDSGNKRSKYAIGDTISVVIESKNKVGDTVSINLKDKTRDFKYNWSILKNDCIEDYQIRSNRDVLKLEVVAP